MQSTGRNRLLPFVAILAWLAAFVAQPAWAQQPPRLVQLQQQLATMTIGVPGDYGLAVMDLSNGEIVSFNGNEPFPMASTVKIAVAATYLSQVDAGRRTLDDKFGGATAAQLMTLMITRSDNAATDKLLAMLGGPRVVDRWVRAQGLTGIRVDRTIAQLLSDRRDLFDVRDSSTPIAMLALLKKLDAGEVLKPESRYLLLDLMSRCITGSNRMRALLPPGTKVEHKTGTLNGLTNDVGFITLADGHRIAVALFARGGVNRPATIATAARTIYDAFAADTGTSYAVAAPGAPTTSFTPSVSFTPTASFTPTTSFTAASAQTDISGTLDGLRTISACFDQPEGAAEGQC